MFKYTFCGILLLLVFSSDHASAFSPTPTSGAGFQPNVGQMDAQVAFWAHRDGIDLFVTTQGELVHRLHGNDDRDWVLVERLEHAQALHPQAVSPEQTQITLLNRDHSRSAHTTRRIDLGEAWSGIRADLQLVDDSFEKRFHLDAGSDVSAIRVAVDGADGMRISADGRLIVTTGLGDVEMSAPVAWQEIDGQRQAVEVAYKLTDESRYGFVLGEYSTGHGLTIDPIIRSTFSGGSGDEGLDHMEVTSDSVYITGWTPATNYPGTSGGFQPSKIQISAWVEISLSAVTAWI